MHFFTENNILDWISYSKDVRTSIVSKNETMIGYIRYEKGKENKPKMILADSKKDLMILLSYLYEIRDSDFENILIPLNPDNCIIKEIEKKYDVSNKIKTNDAFMVKPFENISLSKNVLKDQNSGLMILTIHFDLA